MTHTPPGSPLLRELIEPHVKQGGYPPSRVLAESDVTRMTPDVKKGLIELRELIDKEAGVADTNSTPKDGSPWAKVRIEIRDRAERLLILAPWLIEIETVQLHAIEKGAIPDPDKEESQMRFFRKPNWDFACWTCGGDVAAVAVTHPVWLKNGPGRGAGTGEVRKEIVGYCPHCETAPSPCGTPVYV